MIEFLSFIPFLLCSQMAYNGQALCAVRNEDNNFRAAKKNYRNGEWTLAQCCVPVWSVAENGCTALAQSACPLPCHAERSGVWHGNISLTGKNFRIASYIFLFSEIYLIIFSKIDKI